MSWFEISALAHGADAAGGSTGLPSNGLQAASLPPASLAAMAPWQRQAAAFEARLLAGPPFWQTAEIETAPALIEATLAAFGRRTPTAGELAARE